MSKLLETYRASAHDLHMIPSPAAARLAVSPHRLDAPRSCATCVGRILGTARTGAHDGTDRTTATMTDRFFDWLCDEFGLNIDIRPDLDTLAILYQPGACSPDNLETLAEFMDLPVRELTERQPVTYWRNRYDH